MKLSKEEQQRLLEEKLAKMRADKAKKEKELEKQQELGRIQMNKELNEVSSCFCPIHVSSRNLQIWRGRGASLVGHVPLKTDLHKDSLLEKCHLRQAT